MGGQNAIIEESDVLVDMATRTDSTQEEWSSILCGTSKLLVNRTFPNCKMEFQWNQLCEEVERLRPKVIIR
ncbi:hypothetical protein KY290_014162 [Solanum tuberosum]|uniref:Uncharacterized protein n=1 Tax=Solanum tuberosum TaxID=4113 RepID=A0ABQ7VNW1_SOLTU|nr:hypothetical protein KY284_013558 [Solanum tuberosum]KAH0717572.1 hypothetical protein KY285_013603 [Solanum tuberosum]KAH0770181.1 hypothetical protein KY290_014162 [Solanum tuberosum]